MKIYEVRVTNTEDANDFATMEVTRSDDEETAGVVLDIMSRGMASELAFDCGSGYVVIFEASDGEGYMYDRYTSKKAYEAGEDSEDGGQCTGTLSDAIEMALA